MTPIVDWYFCTTLRMSPEDTHTFLDTLLVLRRPEPQLWELLDATTALGSAPPWLQLYALRPLLAAHGRLAEQGRAKLSEVSGLVDEATGSTSQTYGVPSLGLKVVEICVATLAYTDHPLREQMGDVFAAVVRDDPGALADLLATISEVVAESSKSSVPYQDLNDQIIPTIAVIAMAELTRRRPASTAPAWLGNDADPLLTASLQGEHGRLALLAAVEAAGRADPQAREDLWRALWLHGRGAPHLQPDLLDGMARLWFGYPDSSERPTVATLEEEAITGEDLELWCSIFPPEDQACAESYALLTGRTNGAWDSMAAVLWQCTLWSLAAEIDAVEASSRLRRWWRTSNEDERTTVLTVCVGSESSRAATHLTLLRRISVSGAVPVVSVPDPVEQTEPAVGSAVCSPWVNRQHDGWDHGRKNGPAFRFATNGTPEALVRLLTASELSATLLAAQSANEANDHLAALVFHGVDVLRDYAGLLEDIESGEFNGEHPLGSALAAYAWHVHMTLKDAGTGINDRFDPRLVGEFATRVLTDGSSIDEERDKHWARLSRQSVGAICTIWIRDAWAITSDLPLERGAQRWFQGDPPLALTILVSTLDRFSVLDSRFRELESQERKRPQNAKPAFKGQQAPSRGKLPNGGPRARGFWRPDLMPVALLLRDIYPSDWPQPVRERWPRLDLDWHSPGERARSGAYYQKLLEAAQGDPEAISENVVRAERLLLSPAHPVQIWRQCSAELEAWTRSGPAPLTMRALRLVAALEYWTAAAGFEDREWVEDWLDRVYAVDQSKFLSRQVRTIMINLLKPAPLGADEEYQRLLAGVHEGTIDTIIEFGRKDLRHLGSLLNSLAGDVGLGRESTERLRLRALETLYRQERYQESRLHLMSASEVRQGRDTSVDRHMMIRRFLHELALIEDHVYAKPTERIPILERAFRLWEETLITPSLRANRVPLLDRRRRSSRGMPDLFIAATVVDRFRAQDVSYLLDGLPSREHSSVGSKRIHDFFPNAIYRQGRMKDMGTNRRAVWAVVVAVKSERVWLNAGLGFPLEYHLGAVDPPTNPGDVVAVELKGSPIKVVRLVGVPQPLPAAGEVRRARVRTTVPWLQVVVEGVQGPTYPSQDSLTAEEVRMLWDPDVSRGFAKSEEQEYPLLVQWDANLLNWVPVRRSFNELISDEFRDASPIRLVHAGKDLFVTKPGRLYELRNEDWEDSDAIDVILAARTAGTVLLVAPTLGRNLKLSLERVDDSNLSWLELFGQPENEFTVAIKDSHGYKIQVKSPEGFPSEVVARGAEGGPHRAYVVTTPWSERQARLGEVRVTLMPVTRIRDDDQPTPARFAELYSIAKGDVVELDRIFSTNLNDALVWTTTKAGAAVRLETDSITLLDPHTVERSAPGIIKGRKAEVMRVYSPSGSRKTGDSLTDDQLTDAVQTRDSGADDVRTLIASQDSLDGVVVRRVSDARNGTTMYGTWCRFDTVVHFIELAQGVLGGTQTELVGQVFVGSRAGDHWTFRFTPREITVRGLFRLEEQDSEGTTFVGSDGRRDLYQRPDQPVLIPLPHTGGNELRRLGIANGEISLVDRRPVTTRTVAVVSGKTTRLGKTTFSGNPSGGEVSDVLLRMRSISQSEAAFVDARRMFVITGRQKHVTRAPSRINYAERWQRFLNAGRTHVIGSIAGDSVDISAGLRPPGPDGKLSGRIPLLPGEEPHVAGVPYLTSNARVKLVEHEQGYAASYAQAEPRTVADLLAAMNQQANNPSEMARKFAEPLYYVGPPTQDFDAHLFEWGFGWTVAVPAHQLRVAESSANMAMPSLFHGDQIVSASFEVAENGDPVLVVGWRDIRHRYVRQITEESGQQFLHLLDVEVGVADGTLRVLRAQASQRRGHDPFRSAEWVPLSAGLDDSSRQLILQRLRDAGETGLVRRRILARMDTNRSIASGGRERLFRAVQSGGVGLENKDYVFLTARAIEESSNDLTVIFGRPDAINLDELTVRVNRREFSYREETLARLRDRGLDIDSGQVVMLVRILGPGSNGVWRGSVRDAPARRPETLVSYLASRGGSSYAAFGSTQQRRGRLEIAPGVLFATDGVLGAERAVHGAVVRLELDRHRHVSLTTALPADQAYVPDQGRPAVVLPKSSLLRRDAESRDGHMQRGFVVSGLPDLQVSPTDAALGTNVLASPHPKIVWITKSRSGTLALQLKGPESIRAGRVTGTSPTAAAIVRLQMLPGDQSVQSEQINVPWARMSFANTTARSLSRRCDEFSWRHHDRMTGHVRGGRVKTYELAPGTPRTDGVFFDDNAGWTLRYTPGRLYAFGFSAGALLESTEVEQTFPVAGPSADGQGVWVELGPGRVVEVRGALVSAVGGKALDSFDWSAFSPGDQIGLRFGAVRQHIDGWQAAQMHLELTSWHPAVTGALGRAPRRQGRILLPVKGVDRNDGAIRLAQGSSEHIYPLAINETRRWTEGSAAWLDTRNDVQHLSESAVRVGDTVLLGVDEEGELLVHGLPLVEVQLAPSDERYWPGSKWLHKGMDDPGTRAELLTRLENQLPVTVHALDNEQAVLTVSRERQPTGRWPRGRQIRTEVLARWQHDRLLLRAGSALYSVPLRTVMAGTPHELAGAIAAALSDISSGRPRLVLWWVVDEDGRPRPGLSQPDAALPPGDVLVVPEYEVTAAGLAAGVVCRDIRTEQLFWISASNASWARDIPAGDLLPNLQTVDRLLASRRMDGSLSLTARPAVAQQLRRLELGQPLRITVGKARPRPTNDGRWRYLARIEMPPIMLSYVSREEGHKPGTSRLVEVDHLDRTQQQPEVSTVDVNTRLVTLDLPEWLCVAHKKIVNGDGENIGLKRFHNYARWYREGLPEGTLPHDPVEALIRLAGNLSDSEPTIHAERVRSIARSWLSHHGLMAFNLVGEEALDAAPALAMALALDALGEADDGWAEATVLYLHQLGRRAAASLHTEQFSMGWIGRRDRHGMAGAWKRLKELPLDRELNPRGVRKVRAFCRGMLTKPALRTAESALAPIARSLLAALGELESAEGLAKDAVVLARPALWARTLLPPDGCATAQPQMLPVQREELRVIAEQVIADALPLTLMPVVAPPSRLEQELARRVMKK